MRRTALTIIAAILAASGLAWAEPLGKLFFTPERRAALERQRQLNIQETQPIESATVSLDGIVTRSSGRSTVWVNQRPQNENARGTGITAVVSPKEPDKAVVKPGEEAAASLKVGESINRATGEKTDVLNGGTVTANPPPSR
jgi:hypothetical protein